MSTLPTLHSDTTATQLPPDNDSNIQLADVVPLHPAGTFSSNTQTGDVLNGVARALGVSPPANVIKFPRK